MQHASARRKGMLHGGGDRHTAPRSGKDGTPTPAEPLGQCAWQLPSRGGAGASRHPGAANDALGIMYERHKSGILVALAPGKQCCTAELWPQPSFQDAGRGAHRG